MKTAKTTENDIVQVEIPKEEQPDYARSILAALKNQGAMPLESKHLYYLCDMLEKTLQL